MRSGATEARRQASTETPQRASGRRLLVVLRTLAEVAVVGISLIVTLGSETRLLRG